MESVIRFKTKEECEYELRSLDSETDIPSLYNIVRQPSTGERLEFNAVLASDLPLEVGRRVLLLVREFSQNKPAYYLTTPISQITINQSI